MFARYSRGLYGKTILLREGAPKAYTNKFGFASEQQSDTKKKMTNR